MFTTRQRTLGGILAGVLTAGVLLPVTATTASAGTLVSSDVVLNEVYGGGGNSGSTYTHDFVELRNTGTAPVAVDGWSVQYFSAAGGFGASVTLSGTIDPGDYYLVQGAQGTGGATPLPTPDAVGTFAAAATNGTFVLVSNSDRVTLDRADANGGDPDIVDLVGYGSATHFSGNAAAQVLTNATSASRVANTGENSTDFVRGEPTPMNSAAGTTDPDPDPDPDPEPTDEPTEPTDPQVVSIADIQGTGDVSPLAGQTVTTQGVVTAVWATGGLNGFVIQTAGTGGAYDPAVNTASHGLFVYGSAAAAQVAIGDSVRVTGSVSEYFGLTQISAAPAGVVPLTAPLAPVAPTTITADTDLLAGAEALESMILLPADGTFTITDTYNTNRYGEVGLVLGDQPLWQPGDIMAPGPEATALHNAQLASVILLDDAKTTNFTTTAGARQPVSYISNDEPIRVGAGLSFTSPVVLHYGFDQWRLNPTTPWESSAADGIVFENTRTAAPESVGGDVSVGSFNVLNYFTTLGSQTPGCTAYTDINGNGTNVRGGCDPRGAWDGEDLQRQTEKIVAAIQATDTSVLGLTEIENSARLGKPADEATAYLVARLNEAAGFEKWAYVPTGEAMAEIGASAANQDVIANAIIFQPAQVRLVDVAILADDEAFDNARDPLAGVFAPVAQDVTQTDGEPFLYVINHFKSKGSADEGDTGVQDPVVGNSELSRMQQAAALAAWVPQLQEATGVSDVFLAGDFNAYTVERPLQLFYDAGYTNVVRAAEEVPESWSYTFQSRVGSLDHVLANASAQKRVTGAHHWMINSPEAVLMQYGRHLNNIVDFHRPDPYGSSDHDPVRVGLTAGFGEVVPVTPPTVVATSVQCTSFGFSVEGDVPEGARMRIDWQRGGQGQWTVVGGTQWWSGTGQAGWSNAYARLIAADGTELARSETINPSGCVVTIPTAYHQQKCGAPGNDEVLPVAAHYGYTVTDGGWVIRADRTATWTRVYTANPGYVFPDGTTTHTKVFTDRGIQCTATLTVEGPDAVGRATWLNFRGTVASSDAATPATGQVRVTFQGQRTTVEVQPDGTYTGRLWVPINTSSKTYPLTAEYLGSDAVAGASATDQVRVARPFEQFVDFLIGLFR